MLYQLGSTQENSQLLGEIQYGELITNGMKELKS